MTGTGRSRSQSALLVVGLTMALTLVVLTIATALSQNLFGFTADLEAFDLETGEPSWERTFDVAMSPQLTDDRIYIVQQDSVQALGENGSVQWEAPVANVLRLTATRRVIYADVQDGDQRIVAALSPETGDVAWRLDGPRIAADDGGGLPPTRLWLAAASDTMAVIASDSRYWVVTTESGEPVARFRPSRNQFSVGDDVVAFLSGDGVAVVDVDGTKRTLIDQVPRSTRISGVRGGAVVLNEAGTGSGRVVHAHDTTTGAELWRQTIKGYTASQQVGDYLVVYRSSGIVLLEHPTGALSPGPPWLAASTTDGRRINAAVLSELVESPDSTRYFITENDTIAVDSESGAVLWKMDDQKPVAAAEGVAVTRNKSHMTVVARDSGETLIKIKRAKRSYAAAAGGQLAVVNGGLVQLIAGDGTTATLDDLRAAARIEATSDRYLAVSERTGETDRSRRVIVWDTNSGTRVVDSDYANYWDIDLDRDSLTLLHRDSRTVIDLEDGSTEEVDGSPGWRSPPEPTSAVMVVFDATMTRLLWAHDVAEQSTIGIVGDKLIVSTMGYKHRSALNQPAPTFR